MLYKRFNYDSKVLQGFNVVSGCLMSGGTLRGPGEVARNGIWAGAERI